MFMSFSLTGGAMPSRTLLNITAPVEPEEVNDDMYDSESEDENEYEEIVMI